uniref:DUF4145 domain-containing protein n=1 Tax=Candidatus Methanophaga sp. ANME-1 ERB7 TaxID=2759913 RepID=A0A7G9ZCV6_9EURY|nr:hypothetical protein OJKMNAAM_00012 [Methanosarcinales archaeon ANME-1 ERB7]
MAEKLNPKSRGIEENFDMEIYRLLLFYRQLIQLLETYFSGHLMIPTDEINRNYLRLCNKIVKILGNPGFEDLTRYEWQPFVNLRVLDPDAPDAAWKYGGQQVCGDFLSAIENLFIGTGEKTYSLDTEEQQLLTHGQTYLDEYRSYKKDYEKRWLQKVEKQAEDWKKKEEKTQMKMPQFDFKFIRDKEIKNLLTKDWEETQKAFQNELHKATVLLCGTILESLLIDALSCIEKEAKVNYYQKYLEGKNKGNKPPEIENWQLYQLIEIAKQQGIISADAAKLSHIVRDYRNLIHLFVQKRGQLQIDSPVASAVVNLLAVTYNNIFDWHEKDR